MADIVFPDQSTAEDYLRMHVDSDHPGERTDMIQVGYWNGQQWT